MLFSCPMLGKMLAWQWLSKFAGCVLVLINSVLLNLLCRWIERKHVRTLFQILCTLNIVCQLHALTRIVQATRVQFCLGKRYNSIRVRDQLSPLLLHLLCYVYVCIYMRWYYSNNLRLAVIRVVKQQRLELVTVITSVGCPSDLLRYVLSVKGHI